METMKNAAFPNILVVSCDDGASRELAEQLRKGGFRKLTVVTDGRLAVLCALRQRFDMAVVETCLDGMDGYEVAERLSNLPGKAEPVPVLLVSAEAGEVPEIQAKLLSVAGLLIRPFEPAELIGKAEEALACTAAS